MEPEEKATVGLVLYPGCVYQEVAAAVSLLTESGKLRAFSPSGAPVRTQEGLLLGADQAYSEGAAEGLRALLVPGGDLASVHEDATLRSMLRAAGAREDLVLAGICNGALLLALAGVLKGRACTHTATRELAPGAAFAPLRALAERACEGSRYLDEDVVVDGRVVTARPWAAHRFAERVAVLTGALSRQRAARRVRYLCDERLTEDPQSHLRYVVRLAPVPGRPRARALVEAHVRYLRSLEERGALVAAGPFADGSGGMLVLRAASLEDATRLALADPFVTQGARTATVLAWEQSSEANAHLGVLAEP